MNRTDILLKLTTFWTADECHEVAVMLRAAGQDAAAGVWFEAVDLFERDAS